MRKIVLIMLMIGIMFLSSSAIFAEEIVLKMASSQVAQSLDPAIFAGGTGGDYYPLSALYDGLVQFKGGTGKVIPCLAESWEISEDGKEIVFHLREGVQFHKGYGEFTAEDVKFSFERIIKNEMPEATMWSMLDHVEVIDRYTAKLVMKDAYAPLFTIVLPFNSGMIISKAAVEKMGADAFNENPIGTGPYEFEEWIFGQRVVLVRFDDYWGEAGNLDKIIFVATISPVIPLRAGDIDIAMSFDVKQFEAVSKDPDLISVFRGSRYFWISLPCKDPVFSNVKVRKAFRAALDIDAIVEVAGLGILPRANTLVPSSLLGYWEDAPAYQQDIELARSLLEEAGYPDGFECTYLKSTEYAWDAEIELLQSQLAEVDITMKIEVEEPGKFWEDVVKGELLTMMTYQTLPDPDYALAWFITDQPWNTMKWSNARYDELWNLGKVTMDPEKRKEIYIEMQQLMDEDAALVPTMYGVQGVIAQPYVDLGENDGAVLCNGVLDLRRVSIRG